MGLCGGRLVMQQEANITNVTSKDVVRVQVDPDTQQMTLLGPISGFADHFTPGRELGRGAFSVVREVVENQTNERYAVKCVDKSKMKAVDYNSMAFEVNTLKKLKHPNIIKFYDIYEDDKFYYLVTEFMEGGELFDRIVEKEYYTQHDAKEVVKILLKTIKYCHDNGIAHRDLKPENILLTSKTDDASIKVGDFGLAVTHDNTQSLTTRCGTPEILDNDNRPYGKECDIWSIGVITFMLLSGSPPFYSDNLAELYQQIKKGKYRFDSYYWSHVSEDAKHLISRMLVVDPNQRATAGELLHHCWITGHQGSSVSLVQAMAELRKFNARDTLQRAISTVKTAVRSANNSLVGDSHRRGINGSILSPFVKSPPTTAKSEDDKSDEEAEKSSDGEDNQLFESFIKTTPRVAAVEEMPQDDKEEEEWM